MTEVKTHTKAGWGRGWGSVVGDGETLLEYSVTMCIFLTPARCPGESKSSSIQLFKITSIELFNKL